MRTFLATALLLLVSAGCARQSPAPPAANAAVLVPLAPTADATETTATEVYQGKSANQWAQQLQAPAQLTRHQAAVALGQLDEKGFPHLLAGMRSGSAEQRRVCLEAVYKPIMVKHERETFDLLLGFLKDNDPSLRASALGRLGWFEKRGGPAVPHIRWIALNDRDPVVRDAALNALYQIGNSMSSRPLTHEEFDQEFRRGAR